MKYYTDIRYCVRKINRYDGKTEYAVYENDNLVERGFISKERAQHYLDTYKRLMR